MSISIVLRDNEEWNEAKCSEIAAIRMKYCGQEIILRFLRRLLFLLALTLRYFCRSILYPLQDI